MPKKDKEHRKIQVTWHDHASLVGWFPKNESSEGVSTIESFGFFVSEDKNKIVISHSVCDESEFADPITILKKCIVKRKWVK